MGIPKGQCHPDPFDTVSPTSWSSGELVRSFLLDLSVIIMF